MADPFFVLKATKTIVIPKRFDPKVLLGRDKERPHLFWLHEVVLHAEVVEAGTEFKINIFEVGVNKVRIDATSPQADEDEFLADVRSIMPSLRDLREALPMPQRFTETAAVAILVAMMDRQPKGRKGDLTVEHDNMLFVQPNLVGRARWVGSVPMWSGGIALEHAESYFGQGHRILSPAD